jgi:hypothetical protein
MGKPKGVVAPHLPEATVKYSPEKCCLIFFREMLNALRKYSSFSVDQFRQQDNKDGRHTHYFPDTSEKEGFTTLDPDGLGLEEPWQIRLCPNIHKPPESAWRIHGVLQRDTFYVVWLDYEHKLNEDTRFDYVGG